jgi:hypothetical protein
MAALLKKVGFAGILRAMAAWSEGQRPKNKFLEARSWKVFVAERGFSHRSLIALACELCGEQELRPDDFGQDNDTLCEKWFRSENFDVKKLA